MALASFPLLISRWKRSHLFHVHYRQYPQLGEFLPEEEFDSRLKAIDFHVKSEYPHVFLDTYLFAIAISFVIGTAAFSVAARAINLSMWYPLILLVIPAAIAYITTKRRNAYYGKLSKYYESLQSCLKEFNSLDVPRQIKWTFRRLRDTDTALDLHLPNRLYRYNINFVIDISQINIENELVEEGEILPAYDTSMMDIVLDIGPAVQQSPGNTSDYISSPLSTVSSGAVLLAHPSPPDYGQITSSVELETVAAPPPAYLSNNTSLTRDN